MSFIRLPSDESCISLWKNFKLLDTWIGSYNTQRTHQGKMCCGRTPMQTLIEGKSLWAEKVGQLN